MRTPQSRIFATAYAEGCPVLAERIRQALAETVSGSSVYHLLTDGTTLYLETSPQQIVDILKNSRQPMLAICLSDTVRRVRAVIREGKKSSRSERARVIRRSSKAS